MHNYFDPHGNVETRCRSATCDDPNLNCSDQAVKCESLRLPAKITRAETSTTSLIWCLVIHPSFVAHMSPSHSPCDLVIPALLRSHSGDTVIPTAASMSPCRHSSSSKQLTQLHRQCQNRHVSQVLASSCHNKTRTTGMICFKQKHTLLV